MSCTACARDARIAQLHFEAFRLILFCSVVTKPPVDFVTVLLKHIISIAHLNLLLLIYVEIRVDIFFFFFSLSLYA